MRILAYFIICLFLVPSWGATGAVAEKQIASLEDYCKKHPDAWDGSYNLGREHYLNENYEAANKSFSEALKKCPQPDKQEQIFYNLGNTYYQQAQPLPNEDPTKVSMLEQSVQNYESALALNPKAEDTAHNLKLVKKLLKKLKKEQQKKKQSSVNEDNKDDHSQQDQPKNSPQGNDSKNPSPNDNQQQNEPEKSDQPNKDNSQQPDKQDSQGQNDSQNQDSKAPSPQQPQNSPAGEEKDAAPKNNQGGAMPPPQGSKKQDPKKQEMESILNHAQGQERLLPLNLNDKPGHQDKTTKDW